MAGITSDNAVGRSMDGTLSGEALAEWRSSEQVENGILSTSPPYWDTDDEEDCGPKPSDMYGKYTWKIDKYSQITKRELRSNAFEVGSYKWYILIYPQGCDVSNHLSLFLCVANHDKLLPGWSHFAQFTVAVVNKDPRKSKYSDTLHRFWKKEHDWGWKKFMELSKVLDGFVDAADTLIIKAQVQVIRERPHRPFRCLDSHYRRELVRVYLTNVESICRRFVEERRIKLINLIDNKAGWSSFRAFWIAIDQGVKRHICQENTDFILRVLVKHFFIEKEVTSTLVMDSLYSGLRSLEDNSKGKTYGEQLLIAEEWPMPIVHLEKDMFILVNDVLKLLERAATDSLLPKDDKGPQNLLKDGYLEDCSKDSVARDERRLTQLGRWTIEIFFVTHIFSKIEIAYQEAIALKLQEELIREELAETELKAKRVVAEKNKKSKKKQAKRKRNNRKEKDKGKTDEPGVAVKVNSLQETSDDQRVLMAAVAECLFNKLPLEDVTDEIPSADSEYRDERVASYIDALETVIYTDASSSGVSGHSGVAQRGIRERNNIPLVDDSSSTCSTDSAPSMVVNGLYGGNSLPRSDNRNSSNRVTSHHASATSDDKQCEGINVSIKQISGSGKAESKAMVAAFSMKSQKKDVQHMVKKEKVVYLQMESSIRGPATKQKPSREKAIKVPSSPIAPSKIMSSLIQKKPESKDSAPSKPVLIKTPSTVLLQETQRATALINTSDSTISAKSEAQMVVAQTPTTKPSVQPLPVVSRPLSAPIVAGPKPSAPVVSIAQTSPVLSRSVSAASYHPQSYRNAIMGITQSHSSTTSVNPSKSRTQTPNLIAVPTSSSAVNDERVKPISSGMIDHDETRNVSDSSESPQRENISNPGLGSNVQTSRRDQRPQEETRSSISERLSRFGLGDDFPHLDIIDDLLDENYTRERLPRSNSEIPHLDHRPSFPVDITGMSYDLLPSTCAYEFEQGYYDDGYQLGYGALAGHFDLLELGDVMPQVNQSYYVNEQFDGLTPNQWQMDGADLCFYGMNSAGVDPYPYNFLQYANLACSVMDYTAYGPH